MKARFGLAIDVAVEPERAGTGGALWHARQALDPTFFMLNGDSWFDINLLELGRVMAADTAAAGSIAVRHLLDTSRYGVVVVRDRQGERVCISTNASRRQRICQRRSLRLAIAHRR